MPFEQRKEILESLKVVDEVIASIDADQTVSKTLEMLNPISSLKVETEQVLILFLRLRPVRR